MFSISTWRRRSAPWRLDFKALARIQRQRRAQHSAKILTWCARKAKPCVLVLARPYHMDPGIGHEIEGDLQAHGYPDRVAAISAGRRRFAGLAIRRGSAGQKNQIPLDISDVWTSSYSSNTNEIMWGAKFAARFPWITCVLRLSSYECGMDQPTYTPTQKIVEATGTLFFKFGDLDSTKPSGSIKIRIETIVHYLAKYSEQIMHRKFGWLSPRCPLGDTATANSPLPVADAAQANAAAAH